MAYYWGDYYRGDYHGGFYRGDGWLSSLAGSIGNLLPQSWTPSGARKVGLSVAGLAAAGAAGLYAAPAIASAAGRLFPYAGKVTQAAKTVTPVLAQTMHRIAPNAAASTAAPLPSSSTGANSVGVSAAPSWLGRKKPKKRKAKKTTTTKAIDFVTRMAKARAAKATKKKPAKKRKKK